MMKTWAMYIRGQKAAVPGNGPPQISSPRLPPTNGIERATA